MYTKILFYWQVQAQIVTVFEHLIDYETSSIPDRESVISLKTLMWFDINKMNKCETHFT